jgi:siroheme synthase-like protein
MLASGVHRSFLQAQAPANPTYLRGVRGAVVILHAEKTQEQHYGRASTPEEGRRCRFIIQSFSILPSDAAWWWGAARWQNGTHIPRPFHDEDVEGCALVIAATDRGDVNAHVAATARRRGIWVNVVDTPDACDFIAPAVVRRGALQIAISTGGKSPMLAKRLREGLEALIGPEYGELADILGAMRAAVRYREEPSEVWRAMFQRLIEASCLPLLADVTTVESL